MSKKIIQVTQKISIHSDNLQYIERIERGDSEHSYQENKYFPTLEEIFVDIFERVCKEKLGQKNIKELKDILKTIKEAKEEIKIEIESSNQL